LGGVGGWVDTCWRVGTLCAFVIMYGGRGCECGRVAGDVLRDGGSALPGNTVVKAKNSIDRADD
jgi:hypothetical protein